MVLYVK